MAILNSVLTWVMKKRIHQIELFQKYPHDVQEEVLKNLLEKGKNTKFGNKHGFQDIKTVEQYKEQVPVNDYEGLYPYIEKVMKGESNVLWPGDIRWFAKSSGTTNARSKFIPVSDEALQDCHYKGGKDLISIYVNNFPDTNVFKGKQLALGGSQQVNQLAKHTHSRYGDISAVLMSNLPFWAQFIRTPSLDIALMDDWEAKIEKMTRSTAEENVSTIAGVPTWTIVLIEKILEYTGKDNILEVWPDLELFIHGAVSFVPYRKLFNELIPSPKMNYMETYNASEGFFGIQDQSNSDELLLMLDYGIHYEFIPQGHFHEEHPKTLTLNEVELDKNYALVINSNAGLWRYKIGDTIKFTSLSPYRIKISGRTKHFINAFGEELMVENAERAIAETCEITSTRVEEFTAAPRYIGEGKRGSHEWIIEFERPPDNLDAFADELDARLKALNSDYQAKRSYDIAMVRPIIHQVNRGTFYRWMKNRGKLGGQHKVPRLSNNREYVESILSGISPVSSSRAEV